MQEGCSLPLFISLCLTFRASFNINSGVEGGLGMVVGGGDSGDLRIQTAAAGTLTAFAARLASAWF